MSKSVQIKSGWIFSPWKDLYIFGLPVVAGALITWGLSEYYSNSDYMAKSEMMFQTAFAPTFILRWFFSVLFDYPHAIATIVRIGFDYEDFSRRKWIYLGVPISSFLAVWGLASWSLLYAFRFMAYVNMVHAVRQEYGWVMYSRRRAGEAGGWDRWMDQLMIYTLGIFPILWMHTLPNGAKWFEAGDVLNFLPYKAGLYFEWLYWGIVCVYLVWTIYGLYQGKSQNLMKYYILFLNWIAWYIGVRKVGASWMLDLMHAVSYIVLVFHYGKSKWGSEDSLRGLVFSGAGILCFYIPMVSFALLEAKGHGETQALLFTLFMLPRISHYILDGFIWKTGKSNPDLVNILRLNSGVQVRR